MRTYHRVVLDAGGGAEMILAARERQRRENLVWLAANGFANGAGCWERGCAQCGREFLAERPEAYLCSTRCRANHHAAARRARLLAAKRRRDLHCAMCATPLVGTRADAKTCSDRCRQALHRRQPATKVANG